MVLRGRETAVYSRLALLAAHAAREEIEDARVLAHTVPDPRARAHPGKPIPAATRDRLGPLARAPRARADLPHATPDDYRRIHSRLDVLPGTDPRIFPAVLEVRWQEHGEDPATAEKRGSSGRFEFLLVRSRAGKAAP
jgi:hypothetical protein